MAGADRAWWLTGLALTGAIVGAAYMVAPRAGETPQINGLQHFAIFAQPARVHEERLAREAAARAGKEVDFDTTATILPKGAVRPGREKRPEAADGKPLRDQTSR